MQREHSAGYFGIHTTIYPEYSDQQTQARFRKHDCFTGNGHHRELQHEVNHVAWLLGRELLAAGRAGGRRRHLARAGRSKRCRPAAMPRALSGGLESVRRRSGRVWSLRRSKAPRGSRPGRAWGACWRTASRLVEEDGAIAVCCDLAAAPGAAFQRLLADLRAKRPCGRSAATIPATPCPPCNLPELWRRSRVYLLSRLDPGLVEDLDLVPIGGADELARLARRSGSCLVLANAVHAMVHVENE